MGRKQNIKCLMYCSYCKKEHLVGKSKAKNIIHKFCDKECEKKFKVGSNNPMYGKTHSNLVKEKQSKLAKNKLATKDINGNTFYVSKNDPRYISGELIAESKGRKFSDISKQKMSINKSGKPGKNHSDYSKKLIGEKSKLKFTENFKIKHRKKMEELGHWLKLENKNPYKVYFEQTKFTHGFKTNNINELELLKKYGIFNSKTNPNGCVRDHLLSRKYGYENNIDPKIIAHPANCEIILHSENVRRAHNNSNDCQITLEELLIKIQTYNKGGYPYD